MPNKHDLLIEVRFKDGKPERRCKKCGEWKPFSDFFRRGGAGRRRATAVQRNRPRAKCKTCEKPPRSKSWIEADTLRPLVVECVARIGSAEMARRTGIGKKVIHEYQQPWKKRMTRENAITILHLLRSLREADEWRTPNDIHRNESLRRERREGNGSSITNGATARRRHEPSA